MAFANRRALPVFVACLAIVLLLSNASGLAPVAHAALSLPYTESWESGTSDGWTNLCINPFEFCLGGSAVVATDPAGQQSWVQKITRETQGGDQFSPELAGQPNHTYCVSAMIDWVSGGSPYIGVSYNNASTSSGWNVAWLIGAAEGDATVVVPVDAPGWVQYTVRFTTPANATVLHLVDQVSNAQAHRKPGSPLAYFDDLTIADCGAGIPTPTTPASTPVPNTPTSTPTPTTPASTPVTAGPAVTLLAARVEKAGAGPDLKRPPLTAAKVGDTVQLALYVAIAQNAVKGSPISFTFIARRGGTQVFSRTLQTSVPGTLPTQIRKTAAVPLKAKGKYTFTGTVTYAGQSQQRSATATVSGSNCVIILGQKYCGP